MEQSLNKKFEFKEKIKYFLKDNKFKIIFLSVIILLAVAILFYLEEIENKENLFISEKYIKARLLYSANDKEAAKKNYEEIILIKNNFYSPLALNSILEKNLEDNKKKIIDYFLLLENLKLSPEANDLILLKKALYLIKINELENGEMILKDLVEKESSLKFIAQEFIKK